MFRYLFKEFLRDPWREPGPSEWNKSMYDNLLQEIAAIKFKHKVKKAGLLICGLNQSGKSSFINTVISIDKGRAANVTTAMSSLESVTYHYLRFATEEHFGNFAITDTKGLLESRAGGLNIEDVLYCLQGNIKDGYEFGDNPISSRDKVYYNKSTCQEDESHCLVLVVDANLLELEQFPTKYSNKVKEIVHAMQGHGYPMVLILTKIDELYPYLLKDVTYMYKSSIVKEAVLKASEKLGFQERDIFPVINFTRYTHEINETKCIPVLLALRQMLRYIEDRIEKIYKIRAQNKIKSQSTKS